LVNAERYITEELKEYEAKILGAEERILSLEQTVVLPIGSLDAGIYLPQYKIMAYQIAQLDVFVGFTQLAKENNYVFSGHG